MTNEQEPKIVLIWATPKRVVAVRSDNSGTERDSIEAFLSEAEGATVLDCRKVDFQKASMIVRFGPTPDGSLDPLEYRPATGSGNAIEVAPGVTGRIVSNSDRVGVRLWAEAWASIGNHVKLGTVKAGAVSWEVQTPAATQAPARC